MPYLEINGNTFDPFFIYAAMAHPDNEQYREELVAVLISQCVLELDDKDCDDIELLRSMLRALLTSPSYETVIKRAHSKSHGGSVAGDVLLYVAEMHRTGYKEPSLRKAFYATERYMANAVNADGEKGSSSGQSIHRYWEKYKPVAHLWAAMRMLQLKEKDPHSFDFGLMLSDKLEEFLAIAEYFRVFGEGFVISRIKNPEPILPQGKTWRVPENYSLPSMYVHINEMHDDLKGFLSDYRAPVDINL